MSDYNHEFLEAANFAVGFVPVDLSAGANNGQWISLVDYQKCVAVLYAAAGTSGDDPVITVNQAQDNLGTASKALNFTRIRTLAGSTIPGVSTIVTQSAANTYTATGTGAQQKFIAIEINGSDLDVTNGFQHVQASVAQAAHSQIGGVFYVMFAARHPQRSTVSALS
jgi:hypothetical protein